MPRVPEPTRIIPPYSATVTGTDHGLLSGLAGDDHPQYHNDSRASTWLSTQLGTVVQAQDTSLQDIADVTGQITGDLFRWDGANWVNYPDSNYSGSGHAHSHTALTDLAWSSGAHTGTNNFLAGFSGAGNPVDVDPATLGTLNHTGLSNLAWTSSAHTGTINTIAGFNGAGAAAEYLIGTDLQAYDTDLDTLASLSSADSNFIVGSATGWVVETGDVARTSLGLGTTDSPTWTAATLSGTGEILSVSYRGALGAYINMSDTQGAAPTNATYSAGTKMVLFDSIGSSTTGYAMGIESGAIWMCGHNNTTAYGFNFYGGDVKSVSLRAAGDGIEMLETAALGVNPITGWGRHWIRNDAPNVPMFTNDAGAAFRIAYLDGVIEDLDTLGPPTSDGEFIVATGAGTFAYESDNTARTSLGLGTGDSPTWAAATLTNSGTALHLSSTSEKHILMEAGGLNNPTFTSYSTGTKLVMYDGISASNSGVTLGVSATSMWFTMGLDAASRSFDFYSGLTKTVSIRGAGDGITMLETSALGANPGAGYGRYWIKDDVPNVPMFTNDNTVANQLQYQSAGLDDLAALTPTNGNIIVGDGSNWIVESGNTARTSLGLGTADHPSFNGLDITGARLTMDSGWSIEWEDTGIQRGYFNCNSSGLFDIYADNHIRFYPGNVASLYLTTDGALQVVEVASAPSTTAGRGNFWVQNDVPNTPWFSDDAGTAHQLAYTNTSHSNLTDLDWTTSLHVGTANHVPYFDGTGAAATSINFTYDGADLAIAAGRITLDTLELLEWRNSGGTQKAYILGGPSDSTGSLDLNADTSVRIKPANSATAYFQSAGGIQITEKATSTGSIAGRGTYWVKNDTPNTPWYKDDGSADWEFALQLDDVVFHNITPETDDTYDLGSASLGWANLYLASTIHHKSNLVFQENAAKVTAELHTTGLLDLHNNGYSSPHGGIGIIGNMLTASENLSGTNWATPTAGSAITIDDILAPNDDVVGDKFEVASGSASGNYNLRQTVTVTNTATYTLSFWAKLGTGTFDFIVDLGEGTGATIALTSEWQRYRVPLVAGASDWVDFLISGHDNGTTSQVWLWGVQLILSDATTPYTKTGSSPTSLLTSGQSINNELWIGSIAKILSSEQGAPTFTTRSAGTKFIAQEAITGSTVDYAMGVETDYLWFSTSENLTSTGFKWYAGTSEAMSLTGGTNSLLEIQGGLRLVEVASPPSATANKGTYFVKNDTPNTPYFADDAGTNHQLAYVSDLTAATTYKNPCRVASDTNITVAGSAPDTVDSVTLVVDDRILVTGQTAGAENGIYYVSTLGTGANGTWTRAVDFDDVSTDNIQAGVITYVQEGNHALSYYTLVTTGTIVLNTTVLEFIEGRPIVRSDAAGTDVIGSSGTPSTLTPAATYLAQSGTTSTRDHGDAIWYVTIANKGTATAIRVKIEWLEDGSNLSAQGTEAISAGVATLSVYEAQYDITGESAPFNLPAIALPIAGPAAKVSIRSDAGTTTTAYVRVWRKA